MKSAIVTGATGFVGVHLIKELINNDVSVTALCRLGSSNINRVPKNVQIVYDISDIKKADVFYHLAWDGASGEGRLDPVLQIKNTDMTISFQATANEIGCKRFVALGTIYENLVSQIIDSQKFSGSDFYVLSKAYAHLISNQLALKQGLEYIWCTICHPIGHYIKNEQMMAYTISSLLSGQKPSFGLALTLFDILAVEDVAQGLFLLGATEDLSKREYYIGSGNVKPLNEWLNEAHDILGSDISLGIGERPDDGLVFDKSWFDISSIVTDTGYSPKISFSDAVIKTANWLRQLGNHF